MFNISQPYSGHFYDAEYIEFDENNNAYKVPIFIKIKGHSSIGVDSGVKETIQVQHMNGRWVTKDVFRVHTVNKNDYKPKDKIRFIQEDKTYLVFKVSDDIESGLGMTNMMFPMQDNRPKVLYLGE